MKTITSDGASETTDALRLPLLTRHSDEGNEQSINGAGVLTNRSDPSGILTQSTQVPLNEPWVLDEPQSRCHTESSASTCSSSSSLGTATPATGSSITAAISVMCNTLLGAALLSTPWLCASVGMIRFIFCLIIFGGLSTFSMALLIDLALRLKLRHLGDLIIVAKCIGIGCGSLIIIGDTIPEVLGKTPSWMSEGVYRAVCIILTAIFVVLPASLPKRIRSLRFTNYISLGCLLYILIIVTFAALQQETQFLDVSNDNTETTTLPYPPIIIPTQTIIVPRESGFISVAKTLPVFVFMFTCAQNLLSVSNEMQTRTFHALINVISVSVGMAFGVYLVMGVSGVVASGYGVHSDVLQSLNGENPFVWTAKLLIALSITFTFPLQCHPFRQSLWVLLPKTIRQQHLPQRLDGTIITPHRFQTLRRQEKSFLRNATLFYVASTTLLALIFRDLGLVFQIVGVIGSVTLSFILPCAMYLSMAQCDTWTPMRAGSLALLLFSFCFIPITLYAIIYSRLLEFAEST